MRRLIYILPLGLLLIACDSSTPEGTQNPSENAAKIETEEGADNATSNNAETATEDSSDAQEGVDSMIQVLNLSKEKKKGLKKKHFVANDNLRTETFKTKDGWAYRIYEDDKLILEQLTIPGLDVEDFFVTEMEANRVAELHSYKMKAGSNPMEVVMQDLQNLGITF